MPILLEASWCCWSNMTLKDRTQAKACATLSSPAEIAIAHSASDGIACDDLREPESQWRNSKNEHRPPSVRTRRAPDRFHPVSGSPLRGFACTAPGHPGSSHDGGLQWPCPRSSRTGCVWRLARGASRKSLQIHRNESFHVG